MLFLVDVVGESPADSAVVSDLFVLCFCIRKVGVSFSFSDLLTLFFTGHWERSS